MINEVFEIEDLYKMRERLLKLFCQILERGNP